MKALVAHPSSELYGSDRVALDTVETLIGRGWQVCVALSDDGPLVERMHSVGASVTKCPSPVLRKRALRPSGFVSFVADVFRSIAPGLRLLRSERPDVVYVSTLTIPLWTVLARLTGRPVVVHLHEAESQSPVLVRRALALPMTLAREVVANSRFSRDVAGAGLGRLRRKITVVPNPVVGPARVEPPRSELEPPLRLLYVGRLSPRKGPDVAVRSLRLLIDRGVPARLELLGSVFEGYEWFEAELRSLVVESALDDHVEFRGFVPDIWAEVAAADIVLVPSVMDEPFGNTAVEAVLAARPVVTSRAGGLREAVDGFAIARSVPPGDPDALATAVADLAGSWAEVCERSLGDAALAAGRHAPETYGTRIEELLRAAVSRSRRS